MFHTFRGKLQTVFVLLGLAAIGLTGWEASAGAADALEAATFDRLTAIRQTRVHQVERYFRDLGAHVLALASDESVLEALDAFGKAWPSIPPASTKEEETLRGFYSNLDSSAREWFPTDRRTIALQHRFIAMNPNTAGARDRMLEAPGAYGKAHARFHPTFHGYQTAFGFYDIFLIDAEDLRVLYTVFKEVDLGMGPGDRAYRESALFGVTQAAMQLGEGEYTLRDYKPYAPSHGDPAAFLATPIWRAGTKAGVLVIQVSIREVNRVIAGDSGWREQGLGDTGDAYVVGPDDTLRSDPRLRLEDPVRYAAGLRRAGVAPEVVADVERHGTAILRLPVAPEVARLRKAPAGTERGRDVRGVAVLRSHAPLRVKNIDWALVAEMEETEALAPVRRLRRRIAIVGLLVSAAFLVAAGKLAESVAKPVRALAAGAARLGQRDFSIRLPNAGERKDEIGQLAQAFNRMAGDLEQTTVSKRELQELAGKLLTAQEDERRRIARELHDDLTQQLAAVAIDAGQLERTADEAQRSRGLARIKERMAGLSDEIHRMSRNLHPAILDDLGLAAAIEHECRACFERGGPPVEVRLEAGFDGMPRDRQLALFRIVQEALRNIQKYARAESASVRICREAAGGLRLRIEDDGQGFDRESAEWKRGLGLASMEERARFIGGSLHVDSQPGKGTTIEVFVP